MNRTALLVGVLFVASVSGAPGAGTDADPKSQAAKAAVRKYERAMGKARQAFAREADVARKAAVGELGVALKAATRAADLDEANRISAAIASMKGEGPEAGSTSGVGLLGAWQVVYAGVGNRHVHEFRDDNSVRNNYIDHESWTAKLERDGDGVIARYPNFLERYTVTGDRLFIEQFNPPTLYPNQPPTDMAVGRRDVGEGKPKPSR